LKSPHTSSNLNLINLTNLISQKLSRRKRLSNQVILFSLIIIDANKQDESTDIHNYKPIEEMTKEDLADRLRDNRRELYYYYGSSKRSEQSKLFNKTEFAAKKLRQMWFRAGDLSSHKHIIPIKRLRTRDEGLFKLMNQGELAGVIEGREEFADVDFVVDKQYIKRLDG
jgi:hypothetical protein